MLTTGHERPAAEACRPDAGADPGTSTERVRKRTGGLYGRLPKALVLASDRRTPPLSPEATCLLAYRSLHTDGKDWGCHHAKVAEAFRGGFSRHSFQRVVRELKAAGLLEREQGKRKRAGRGRGYAIDRITFERPTINYVLVERDLFDGTLTRTEIAAILYLRARGDRYAKPWQLMSRLGVTRPTLSTIMRGCSKRGARKAQTGLLARGIAKNYGSEAHPLWGLVTLKNPTLNTTSLKRTTRTRSTYPSRQISPPQIAPKQSTDPSPADECRTPRPLKPVEFAEGGGDRLIPFDQTDAVYVDKNEISVPWAAANALAIGKTEAAKAAMGTDADHLPFSAAALVEVRRLCVDRKKLIARYFAKTKGKRIKDPSAYLVRMAHDEVAKRNGVSIQLAAKISAKDPQERAAAMADAVRAAPREDLEALKARNALPRKSAEEAWAEQRAQSRAGRHGGRPRRAA